MRLPGPVRRCRGKWNEAHEMTTAAVRELLRSSKAAAVVFPLSYNGVLFTRALHAEGVPVVGVVQPPRDCFWWTWSCRKVVVDDLYGEDTVATLIALGEIADIKPVLIATSDEGLLFITRHRERLAPFFRINVPRADTAALLMDKLSLYGWGSDRFDFPKTLAIHSDDELARAGERGDDAGDHQADLSRRELAARARQGSAVRRHSYDGGLLSRGQGPRADLPGFGVRPGW